VEILVLNSFLTISRTAIDSEFKDSYFLACSLLSAPKSFANISLFSSFVGALNPFYYF
jgi:hypothetical protein